MDQQTLVNILFGIVLAGGGWWMKNLWAMVMNQQQQIGELTRDLVGNYVPRRELQDTFNRIFERLDEIQREIAHISRSQASISVLRDELSKRGA